MAQKKRQQGERHILIHGKYPYSQKYKRNLKDKQKKEHQIQFFKQLNSRIVGHLHREDISAVGITGMHKNHIRSKFLTEELNGCTAAPPSIHIGFFQRMLSKDLLPVLSPFCFDKKDEKVLLPPETLAESLTTNLSVESLVFLTQQKNLWSGDKGQKALSVEETRSVLPQITRYSAHWASILQVALKAIRHQCSHVLVGNAQSLQQRTATIIY